jgi:hypothetical protein
VLTPEVLRGFRAMACALTAPQAEHSDVRAACEWLELAANDVKALQSTGRSVAVAKDVYEECKRVFRTNLPRDLYDACGRAFGTTRDDAKERLLAAMYGTNKKKLDGRKDKPPEAPLKEPPQTALYSPRGIPLVWRGGHPKDGAVLTIECYCKWYELFLVCPDTIVGIDFGVLDQHSKDESPYSDHAPNPRAVYRYAQAGGYQLDNEAFEMIIGRWEIEYRENYDIEQEDNRDV